MKSPKHGNLYGGSVMEKQYSNDGFESHQQTMGVRKGKTSFVKGKPSFEVTAKATTNSDARRFAVYCAEEALRAGQITVHQLPFIERALYEMALGDNFKVGPLPRELRMKEMQAWDIKSLKLHLEPASHSGDYVNQGTEKLYEYWWHKIFDMNHSRKKPRDRPKKKGNRMRTSKRPTKERLVFVSC
jgi:hypothetical protein